jgi:hypothetical protein
MRGENKSDENGCTHTLAHIALWDKEKGYHHLDFLVYALVKRHHPQLRVCQLRKNKRFLPLFFVFRRTNAHMWLGLPCHVSLLFQQDLRTLQLPWS